MSINVEKIIHLRKLRKLSQGDFGAMLGVSKQMVSHWENKRNEIPLKYYEKISEVFHLNIKDIQIDRTEYNHWKSEISRLSQQTGFDIETNELGYFKWCKKRVEFLESNNNDSVSTVKVSANVVTELQNKIKIYSINEVSDFLRVPKIFLEKLHAGTMVDVRFFLRLAPLLVNFNSEESDFYTHEDIIRSFKDVKTWLNIGYCAYYNLPKKIVDRCIEEDMQHRKTLENLEDLIKAKDLEKNIIPKGLTEEELKEKTKYWNNKECNIEACHTDCSEFRRVPVVACASALEPGEYAQNSLDHSGTDEYVAFPNALDSDIAIKVFGESMLPWYPEGTYLLVSTKDMAITGDRVVVELADGEILFKIYIDQGDQFQLRSINRNNGEDMTIDKRSDDFRRIYPVKQSMRDERKLDKEMNKSNVKHFWQE